MIKKTARFFSYLNRSDSLLQLALKTAFTAPAMRPKRKRSPYGSNAVCPLMSVTLTFCLLLFVSAAFADGQARSQEINECRPHEISIWNDGADRPLASPNLIFSYNHQNSPEWFTKPQVSSMVSRAATAWSQCGIGAYITPFNHANASKDLIVIQWNEKESRGNFALANLTQRTLSLSPKGFELLRARNPAYDASQTLQMAISHEMGHFFGLMAHSRRCIDVMSYYHNARGEKCFKRSQQTANSANRVVEYRHLLPTACDIERCRKVNGKSPLPGGRLTY